MSSTVSLQPDTAAVAPAQRPAIHDLHALLYRKIGISAVAAVLTVTNEARARDDGRRQIHPLPAILQGQDLAA